jgi:hypothetical protein
MNKNNPRIVFYSNLFHTSRHSNTSMLMLLWVLVPYILIGRYRSFGKTYCLHLQGLITSPHSRENLKSLTRQCWVNIHTPVINLLFTICGEIKKMIVWEDINEKHQSFFTRPWFFRSSRKSRWVFLWVLYTRYTYVLCNLKGRSTCTKPKLLIIISSWIGRISCSGL